jgi:hypothetical protein
MKLLRDMVLAKGAPIGPMGSEMAIVFLLPFLVTCRQIVGIEHREVFDGDASDTQLLSCGLPNRGGECASCMTEHCCAKAQKCVADETGCFLAEQCVQACAPGDSSCQLRCAKQWDPVNTVQAQLADCRDPACADKCGPWDCLGNVQWMIPNPFPPMITIRATARCASCSPIGGGDPNESVRVRVCSFADTNCDAELARGNTAHDGTVSLMVATQGKPLSVFLEFHKDGWLDDLLLLNTPPLSYDFDVGVVDMDTLESVQQLAIDSQTTYDPSLAIVKLTINDCNLRPSRAIDLSWADQGAAAIHQTDRTGWSAIAVNLPVSKTRTTRLVARLKEPAPAIIAAANLVVRENAVTLAPFVTPTP